MVTKMTCISESDGGPTSLYLLLKMDKTYMSPRWLIRQQKAFGLCSDRFDVPQAAWSCLVRLAL